MFKMSGNVRQIFRRLALCQFTKINEKMVPSFSILNIGYNRNLYSRTSLGLDAFVQQRDRTKQQLSNLEDKFKERMKDYADDEKNMIFTEDLKNMIHLANNDEEAKLVVSMIERFNRQNKQLRFGHFKFGPVVMRLFHTLNKPDLAMQCFRTEESSGFFDQLVTFQIYLDLLYENKMYKEVLEEFERIISRQIEGAMFPRNSIVLVFAACYKLNNAESLTYAFKIWKKMEESGYFATRRAVTYCAALAMNQGKAEAALEIIANAKNQSYTTVRNIKVLTLAKLGRLEDVLPLLKSVLEQDIPGKDVHTFNKDVMEEIKKRFIEEDNAELIVQFNKIEQLFHKQGHISDKTLDEQMCAEIQLPSLPKNQQGNTYGYNRSRNTYENRDQRQDYRYKPRQRPGLEDLV